MSCAEFVMIKMLAGVTRPRAGRLANYRCYVHGTIMYTLYGVGYVHDIIMYTLYGVGYLHDDTIMYILYGVGYVHDIIMYTLYRSGLCA